MPFLPPNHEAAQQGFPATRWTLIRKACAAGEESGSLDALQQLCLNYWFPLYAWARHSRWSDEDGQDLIQSFFEQLIEKGFLASADPQKCTRRRIKQFENFNGPVHYFNDLLIFVGQHRSVNGGKSFENYIQIDKLAQAIESQYGFLPKRLQVRHIETKAPFRLKIEIETGSRKIIMESPLFTQDWKAVKI